MQGGWQVFRMVALFCDALSIMTNASGLQWRQSVPGFPLSTISGCHLCSGFAFLLLLRDYTEHILFFWVPFGLTFWPCYCCLELPNKPPFVFTSHLEGTHTFMKHTSTNPNVPLCFFFSLILLWSPVGTNVQPVHGSYHGTAIHCDWAWYYLSSEIAIAIDVYMNVVRVSSHFDCGHPRFFLGGGTFRCVH